MKQMPMIEKFMTPMPHTINSKLPIKEALEMMRTHRIRHLPVQHAGQLVGILTDRDVKLASSFSDPDNYKVEDVMTPEPYTVAPKAALDHVVFEMAEHKYGCAVVKQDNGKIVGIFTATDGLRVLGEVLDSHYKPATA